MLQSIGKKGVNASSSQLTEIRKQKVLANLYAQQLPGQGSPINTLKTRGAVSVPQIRAFRPDLNVYAQITSGPIGAVPGVEPVQIDITAYNTPVDVDVTSTTFKLTVVSGTYSESAYEFRLRLEGDLRDGVPLPTISNRSGFELNDFNPAGYFQELLDGNTLLIIYGANQVVLPGATLTLTFDRLVKVIQARITD